MISTVKTSKVMINQPEGQLCNIFGMLEGYIREILSYGGRYMLLLCFLGLEFIYLFWLVT